MIAYFSLLMDRPIDDGQVIIPGSFIVKANDTQYQFDFLEGMYDIDTDNPCVCNYKLRDEDYNTFPETEELLKHLYEITEFIEFYIHTGEDDEHEIYPLKLLEFTIIDYGLASKADFTPKSTEFVIVTDVSNNHHYGYQYNFTEKLLKTLHKFELS